MQRKWPQINQVKQEIHELKGRLFQTRSRTTEYVFSTRNNENTVSWMIDLHGQTKEKALSVTLEYLTNTKSRLDTNELEPNVGNGKDHIYKVITGAGNHSKKGAVLKPAIDEMLKSMNFEHYSELQHGVFLVRLTK